MNEETLNAIRMREAGDAEFIAQTAVHVSPDACGTCRRYAVQGLPVEHVECAARARVVRAPDYPGWDELRLGALTREECAALPARFHIPIWSDLAMPGRWNCAVCWGDGWTSAWPCKTAAEHGDLVFERGSHV